MFDYFFMQLNRSLVATAPCVLLLCVKGVTDRHLDENICTVTNRSGQTSILRCYAVQCNLLDGSQPTKYPSVLTSCQGWPHVLELEADDKVHTVRSLIGKKAAVAFFHLKIFIRQMYL